MSHRCPVVDLVLAAPRRNAGTRRSRHHHRAHHDDDPDQCQRFAAQDLLSQKHRYLPHNLFYYGLRVAARVCLRRLSQSCHANDDDKEGGSPAAAAATAAESASY